MASLHQAALFLLVLCVADMAQSLQYPLQYHYHYRGRVSAGVPEINNKRLAVSDIKADLYVYVTEEDTATFKLDNVLVGDFDGTLDCELDALDSLESYRTPGADEPGALIGRHPFKASTDEIQFDPEDPQWLTNFYKSIAALFLPLRYAQFSGSNNTYTDSAYTTREGTVMGRCEVTNTQERLSGVAANEHQKFLDHHVEEDVQLDEAAAQTSKTGRKTTGGRKVPSRKTTGRKVPAGQTPERVVQVPVIDKTVWQLIKSVNLEDCDDRVEHQHTLRGIYCNMAKDQCKNAMSRNSHGVFFLRGGENGMRIEKAIVRGAVLVSPFGFDTEMLSSQTIQRIAMVSVKSLGSSRPTMGADTVRSDTIMFTMILPYGGTQVTNPHVWAKLGTLREALEQFTATKFTDEQQAINEQMALHLMKTGITSLEVLNSQKQNGNSAVLFNYVTMILYDFDDEQMENFASMALNTLPEESFDLLSGVLAEVGSEAAVKVITRWMTEGKLSPRRQALFFATMGKNAKTAKVLKILLDYLKSEDLDATPFKTSQSYINFASLIYKLCLRSSSNYGSFGKFSKQICEEDDIVATFESLIIPQLETADKFWKQMVLVKTLVELRSSEGAEALVPFVLGTVKCDKTVRLTAMVAFSSWKSHCYCSNSKEKAILLLLRTFENPSESGHIRARALSYLVSWPLSSTIWSRLAFSTQRPLLQDLSAFTYSLIKSVSEYKNPEVMQQALYASHAVRLAKPASALRRYSSYKTFYYYCFHDKIGTIQNGEIIRDPMSPLPSEISVYLQKVFGGTVLYKKFNMMLSNDYGDVDLIAIELFQDKILNQDHGTSGGWDRFLGMLKSGLNIDERVRDVIRGAVEYVPLSDMLMFIPLQHEFIKDAFTAVFGSDLAPKNYDGSSYFNQMDITFVTTNNLGLPVIINLANPVAVTYKGNFYFGNTANERYELQMRDLYFGVSNNVRTNMETMALWSGKKVACGVSHSTTIQLPFDINVLMQFRHVNLERYPRFELSVAPNAHAGDQEVSVVHITNVPYTLMRSTTIGDATEAAAKAKPILKEDTKLNDVQSHSYLSGIKIKCARDSVRDEPKRDDEDPIKQLIAPDAHFMDREVILDMSVYKGGLLSINASTSELKRDARRAGAYVSKYGKDSFVNEGCGEQEEDFGQQTGQTADDYDYMFSQQSTSQNNLEFQTFDSQQTQELSSFGEQAPQKLVLDPPSDAELARASYGVPDADEPILEKYMRYLRREKGWNEKIRGMSVRIETTVNDESKAYEMAHAGTVCDKYKDQRMYQFVTVFATSLSSCLTTCYDGTMTLPKLSDMDTLSTLTAKDLARNIQLQQYSGTGCKDGPYAAWNETRTLNEDKLKNLVQSLQSDCAEYRSSSGDPVDDFLKIAFYDRIVTSEDKYSVENPTCPKSPLHDIMQHRFKEIFKGVLGHNAYDYCAWESDDTTNVYSDIERHQGSAFTGITKYTSNKGTVKEKPFYLQSAPKWLEYAVNRVVHMGNEYEFADYCVIAKDSLTTFDGLKVDFSVDPCPTLAMTNCEAGTHDTFAVAVSSGRDGELAVNIVSRYKKTVASIDSNGVTVNNEPLKDDEYFKDIEVGNEYSRKEKVGQIIRRNGFVKIELTGAFAIIKKEDKVYIKIINPRYNGYVCGLCGNHDNEPYNDMKQPNGCLLTDAEQFKKSWIPSSSFTCYSSEPASKEFCLQEGAGPQNPDYEITKIY